MLSKYDVMLNTTIDPWDTFRAFDTLLGTPTGRRSRYDVEATDDGLVLSIELPGVPASDVAVSTSDRLLTVSGARRGQKFSHSYALSRDYDPATGEATLTDGVLTLRFSRTVESRPRSIPVKVG